MPLALIEGHSTYLLQKYRAANGILLLEMRPRIGRSHPSFVLVPTPDRDFLLDILYGSPGVLPRPDPVLAFIFSR